MPIEAGVLRYYICDSYSARKIGATVVVNYRDFDMVRALEIAGEDGFGDPVMSDLIVKTTTHLNPANRVSILGIHSSDRLVRAPRLGPLTEDAAFEPALLDSVAVLKLSEDEARIVAGVSEIERQLADAAHSDGRISLLMNRNAPHYSRISSAGISGRSSSTRVVSAIDLSAAIGA